MARVKRNKINFKAREKDEPVINYMTINHFVPIVKRNEDLYSFVVTADSVIEKLSIFVSTMKEIESFSLNVFSYNGANFTRKVYEIKQGVNNFEDGDTLVDAGEAVRLDIPGIDSVYQNISGVTIGIQLSDRVGSKK